MPSVLLVTIDKNRCGNIYICCQLIKLVSNHHAKCYFLHDRGKLMLETLYEKSCLAKSVGIWLEKFLGWSILDQTLWIKMLLTNWLTVSQWGNIGGNEQLANLLTNFSQLIFGQLIYWPQSDPKDTWKWLQVHQSDPRIPSKWPQETLRVNQGYPQSDIRVPSEWPQGTPRLASNWPLGFPQSDPRVSSK